MRPAADRGRVGRAGQIVHGSNQDAVEFFHPHRAQMGIGGHEKGNVRPAGPRAVGNDQRRLGRTPGQQRREEA